MRTLLIGLSILCIGSGCFQKVQYIGRNYTPTSGIEMFFSPVDVGKEYIVIGKVVGQTIKLKKAQKKFIEVAKNNGADGIIIYVPGGESTDVAHSRKSHPPMYPLLDLRKVAPARLQLLQVALKIHSTETLLNTGNFNLILKILSPSLTVSNAGGLVKWHVYL